MKNKQKHTQTNTKTLQRRQIHTVEFKPQIIKHEDENTSNVAAVTKLMELMLLVCLRTGLQRSRRGFMFLQNRWDCSEVTPRVNGSTDEELAQLACEGNIY